MSPQKIITGIAVLLAFVWMYLAGGYARGQASGDVVTWVNPTTRTDGSALTNLASTTISYGAKGGPYTSSVSVSAPATTITAPRAAGPGTVCYVAVAVDALGLQSAPSAEVCKTIVALPNAPSGLSVK